MLPVDRAWGELLVKADEHLVPIVAACASIESLHRMLRQQDNDIGAYVVKGSDHLTAYAIYQDALETTGSLGSVYGLPRHVFDAEALEKWCEERGVMMRSIEDAALAIASIFRGLDLELPRNLPELNPQLDREWRALVARVMPFDLVIDEETSWGEHVNVSKTSVASSYGAVAGEIVYFADKMGRARGSISGTNIPDDMVWEYASPGEGEVVYDPAHRRAPLRIRRTQGFHGFVLESEDEGISKFPARDGGRVPARAGGGARQRAGVPPGHEPHPRDPARAARGVPPLRRDHGAGGREGADGPPARQAGGGEELHGVHGDAAARGPGRAGAGGGAGAVDGAAGPHLDRGALVSRWTTCWRATQAVVRARIPAKTLNEVDESELPELDRPLHWTVTRGKHEAVRAATLDEARVAVRDTSSATRDRARDQEEGGSGGGRARGEGGRGRRAGQRKGHGGRDRNGGGEDRHGRGGRGGGGARHKKGGKGGGRRKARH